MSIVDKVLEIAAATIWKMGPVIGKIPQTPRGYLDFAHDPDEIRRLFQAVEGRKVDRFGIAARPSGLIILDLDCKNDLDGVMEFKSKNIGRPQIEYGPLQRTPSGGYHLFFRYPAGVEIRNRASVFPGIDVRTDGFVASGAGYGWVRGHDFRAPIPPLPDWWIDMLADPQKRTYTPPQGCNNPPPRGELVRHLFSHYMAEAIPGNRDRACYLFGLQLKHADIPLADAEIQAAKFAAACPAGSHPFTEAEALRAVRSAYKSRMTRPAWVVHNDRK